MRCWQSVSRPLVAGALAGLLAAPAAAQQPEETPRPRRSPAAAPAPPESDDAYLGVYLTELTDAARKALGLPEGQGVLIEDVVHGEAAEEAGLRAGDVVLSLGGGAVEGSASLGRAVDRAGAGSTVEVVILRDGKRESRKVTIGSRRDSRAIWSSGLFTSAAPEAIELPPPLWISGDPHRRLGLRTAELTGQLADYFEVPRGLLVTWVVPNGLAGKAGVQAGDVLVSLAGQPIGREEDLAFILGSSDRGEEISLEIVRRGQKKSLTLKL
jgi:serine protease Do